MQDQANSEVPVRHDNYSCNINAPINNDSESLQVVNCQATALMHVYVQLFESFCKLERSVLMIMCHEQSRFRCHDPAYCEVLQLD